MNSPCDTCAFGKSGGAADESNNRLKGHLAARGPILFLCHHTRSGVECDWKTPGSLGPMALPPSERKVCAGWRAEVGELNRRGKFKFTDDQADNAVLRRYQQSLASDAIRALDAFLERGISAEEKERRNTMLRDLVRAVADVREE